MLISSQNYRLWAGILIVALLPVTAAAGGRWGIAAEQLAAKIAAVTGPETVAWQLDNRSSLGRSEAEEIRRGLTSELALRGVHVVNAEQAAASIQVSLSENLQEYVWVADIRQGNNEASVVMASLPKPEAGAAVHEAPPLAIHKTLLWSQEERILDVAIMDGSPAHMAVLDPGKVTFFRFQDSRWQPEQSLAVSHAHPWPRDMRGRLALRKDRLADAYLPGVFCRSTTTAPLALNCYESDDPWPLASGEYKLSGFYTPTRNFFTGALVPGVGSKTTAPPFYSAAPLPREKYTLWLLATVDGKVHLLDGITDQAAKLGWGSDIASVHSGCGAGWQVLVTGTAEGDDAVRAFEVPDREAIAAGPATGFSGAISALWTESSGTGAVAVSRNKETGKYEAYRLTVVCGQ